MAGDIDIGLSHYFYGLGVYADRINTGAESLYTIAFELFRPALGHLAPAGIARTQKQDIQFFLFYGHLKYLKN
jgi:hypothetical protein